MNRNGWVALTFHTLFIIFILIFLLRVAGRAVERGIHYHAHQFLNHPFI